MDTENKFRGFPRELLSFYRNLKKNNNKAWFEKHRTEYETYVLEPAKAFVVALGQRFRAGGVNIKAEPKLNRSIFRIYRDTRFSPDKTPYKTRLALYFWEGNLPRMESPGFYIQIEPSKLLLAAGAYIFSPKQLALYRKAVVDPERGQKLSGLIDKISRQKDFKLVEKHYRRIPAGYGTGSPNAELLLYNGLHVWQETPIPEEFYSARFIDYCWTKFKPFLALHAWLLTLISGRI